MPWRQRLQSRAKAPVLALTALSALTALTGCDALTGQQAEAEAARVSDAGFSAADARIVETGADGGPRYALRAARIQQNPRSRQVTLEQLSMQVRDPEDVASTGEGWRLTAVRGRMPEDASHIELEGDVRVAGTMDGGAGPIEIRTEELRYDLASGIARSGVDVSIGLAGRRLEARGIEADLKQRQVRLESRVHGRFVP